MEGKQQQTIQMNHVTILNKKHKHSKYNPTCNVFVIWHWEPMVTSQYGLLFPENTEKTKRLTYEGRGSKF